MCFRNDYTLCDYRRIYLSECNFAAVSVRDSGATKESGATNDDGDEEEEKEDGELTTLTPSVELNASPAKMKEMDYIRAAAMVIPM